MSAAREKKDDGLAAVMRAMDILELLKGHAFKGLALREIAAALKLTDSTALRTLEAMEKRGFVQQYADTRRWAHSVKVLGIARAYDYELHRRLTHTHEFDQRVSAEAAT